MRNYQLISMLLASSFLTACATSPSSLKERQPDFEQTVKASSISRISECLVKKIEAYPVLAGLGFEDRTLPVQLRQYNASAELYQMQGPWAVSLVELKQINASKLYTTIRVNNGLITYDRTMNAYKGFIASCS